MLKPENTEEQKPSRRDVARYGLYDIVQSLTTVEYKDDRPLYDFYQQIKLISWLFEDIMDVYDYEKECGMGDSDFSIVEEVDNLFYNDLLDYFTIEELEKYLTYKKEIEEERRKDREDTNGED